MRRIVVGLVMVAVMVAAGALQADPALAQLETKTIVPYGDDYMYKVNAGDSSGFELPNFDDGSSSGFETGGAPFGHAICDGPECGGWNQEMCNGGDPPVPNTKAVSYSQETVTDWPTSTDIALRKEFELPAGSKNLKVELALDNDVEVFLNGTSIGSAAKDGCAYRPNAEFVAPDSLLTTGTNLLAVHGTDRGAVDFLDVQVTADVPPPLKITSLQLNDIDNRPLQFLSTDDHDYFDSDERLDNTLDGNTRIHGTIALNGLPGDKVEALDLEISGNGVVTTVPMESDVLGLVPVFGSDGQVSINTSQLLYKLPSAQAVRFSWFPHSTTNGDVQLRVSARTQNGHTAESTAKTVPKLVRYTAKNRTGPTTRDGTTGPNLINQGGDDWVLPSVRMLAEHFNQGGLDCNGPGISWNDFSNMNGGPFPIHGGHQNGQEIDGCFPDYRVWDRRANAWRVNGAAAANGMIGYLNDATYGRRIQRVYVAFADRDPFWRAANNVILNDGRRACCGRVTDVIRPDANHADHFHWNVSAQ